MKKFPRRTVVAALAGVVAAAAGAPSPGAGLKTSMTFRLRLKPSTDPKTGEEHPVDAAALARTEKALRVRLASAGIGNVVFQQEPPDHLTVTGDGLTPEQVSIFRRSVVHTAALDLRTVHGDNDTLLPQIESKKAALDPAWIVLPKKENSHGVFPQRLIVKRIPEITGDEIAEAFATYDLEGWSLSVELNKKAGERFFDITKRMRKGVDRFAIVLDGKIISAPTTQVDGGIAGGSFRLTGNFTEQEVRSLASALMNPLRNPVVIEEERVKQ